MTSEPEARRRREEQGRVKREVTEWMEWFTLFKPQEPKLFSIKQNLTIHAHL